MNIYDASEYAYKNGYEAGVKKSLKEINCLKADIENLKQQALEDAEEIEMLKEVTTNTINTSIEFGLDKINQIKKVKSETIKEYKEKVKSILINKGLYLVAVKNAMNEAEKEING